ncbi:DUF423 domain-containing protein [Flavobacteriaceae bacterium D16]|nr:DUF423 domain-containing protein [Flavobacteriaceae bacterium D16]
MNKTTCIIGIVFGVTAIVLGAFGAHGLEAVLSDSQLDTFETGVKYQMYHALLLLIVSQLRSIPPNYRKRVTYLTTMGVVLFSFSIYFLATNELTGFDFKAIGFITPIGGLLLISAWGLLGFGVIKSRTSQGD